jgi:hypothetical protein
VKCHSLYHFTGSFTCRFTLPCSEALDTTADGPRTKDRKRRGPNAAEAGATPSPDAQCVTGPHGVAPASWRRKNAPVLEAAWTIRSKRFTTWRKNMAMIKKPPETVERNIRLEEPVSRLLDEYSRFVDCSPDYVANFALRRMLARDPEYKKWKASQTAASPRKTGGESAHLSRSA